MAYVEAEIARLTQALDFAYSSIASLKDTQATSITKPGKICLGVLLKGFLIYTVVLELLIDDKVAAYDASLTRLEDIGLVILRDYRLSKSGLPVSNDYFVLLIIS